MKKSFYLIFSILLFWNQFSFAQTVDDPRIANGIWLYKGGTDAYARIQGKKITYKDFKKMYPYVVGVFNPIPWSLIEPEPGKFQWKEFDENLKQMADAGYFIGFIFWAGPHSPEWLYSEFGVEKVFTNTTKKSMPFFPNYKNADYKKRWYNMLNTVAEHINSLDNDIKNWIVFYQPAEGTTGDEGPFKGAADPSSKKYIFSAKDPWWINFKRDEWEHLYKLYSINNDPIIHLLINGSENEEDWEWKEKHIPYAWEKSNNIGHVYQANGDALKKAHFDPLINEPVEGSNKTLIRTRDEFGSQFAPTYDLITAWFTYWTALHSLHFGLDIWNLHLTKEFFDPGNKPAFQFFAKYAGFKNPKYSPGGFCALRDGLDAANFKRFPESEFGGGDSRSKNGEKRTVNIAKAFAAQGARQEDPEGSMGGQVNNHHAKGINDVNWDIFPANYERYITQYAPNETSVGYWSVGSKEQPYGRFARGFDHKNGKNAMYFNIHDSLFSSFPNGGKQTVILRVVYLDNGGSWKLIYDAVGNESKTAFEMKNGNSGLWKEKIITINDANFANRLPHNSDFSLMNSTTNGTDPIFHMVEVTKEGS